MNNNIVSKVIRKLLGSLGEMPFYTQEEPSVAVVNTVVVNQASNTVVNTGVVSGGISINSCSKKD